VFIRYLTACHSRPPGIPVREFPGILRIAICKFFVQVFNSQHAAALLYVCNRSSLRYWPLPVSVLTLTNGLDFQVPTCGFLLVFNTKMHRCWARGMGQTDGQTDGWMDLQLSAKCLPVVGRGHDTARQNRWPVPILMWGQNPNPFSCLSFTSWW